MLATPSIQFFGAVPGALAAESLADTYGIKTAGIWDPLLALQNESPVPYSVPEAIALTPRSCGGVTSSDLDQAFEQISAYSNEPRPWLARSSALNEKSGSNDSPPFYVDPQDRRGSLRAFKTTVERMMDSDADLGVLLMPMVGAWSKLGGMRVFGAEIVSFAADTVNPFRSTEMHFAFVQGLGIGAVGMGKNAVLVTVDRDSGEITFLGNRDKRVLRKHTGSTSVPLEPETYRQKTRHFFDPKKLDIASLPLTDKYFQEHDHRLLTISDGRFVRLPKNVLLTSSEGIMPFDDPETFSNLVSIMQFIHAKRGRSQIEGAFLRRTAQFPFLYQHITPPPSPTLDRDLMPLQRHIYSNEVIGCGSFEGPLVWYIPRNPELSMAGICKLMDIDKKFAETGYIMLGAQDREVMNHTPNCRHRISEEPLNASGHAITLMREEMCEHPEISVTITENAQVMQKNYGSRAIAGIKGKIIDEDESAITVFEKVRLDSNGRELAVEIVGKRNPFSGILAKVFAW